MTAAALPPHAAQSRSPACPLPPRQNLRMPPPVAHLVASKAKGVSQHVSHQAGTEATVQRPRAVGGNHAARHLQQIAAHAARDCRGGHGAGDGGALSEQQQQQAAASQVAPPSPPLHSNCTATDAHTHRQLPDGMAAGNADSSRQMMHAGSPGCHTCHHHAHLTSLCALPRVGSTRRRLQRPQPPPPAAARGWPAQQSVLLVLLLLLGSRLLLPQLRLPSCAAAWRPRSDP